MTRPVAPPDWNQGPVSAPPPSDPGWLERNVGRLAGALTLLLVGGLAAGLFYLYTLEEADEMSEEAGGGVSLTDIADVPDEWPSEWADHVRFVEQTRGLEFVHPVNIERVSIAESLASEPDSQRATSESEVDNSWWDPYIVFGLMSDDLDADDEYSQVEQVWAAAWYDPDSLTINIPEGEDSLVLQSTVVHELTHALQHQHQMLDAPSTTTDSINAHHALIEGDADWVEARWEETLSPEDFDLLISQYDQVEFDRNPTDEGYLMSVFATPYIFGDPAVDLIRERSGQEELDRLLLEGVPTSELLVDPFGTSVYPSSASRVLLSEREFEVEYYDALGPIDLYHMLVPELGPADAMEAVLGYDLDRYELWYNEDGHACVELVLWMDTDLDLSQIEVAFSRIGVVSERGSFGKPRAEGLSISGCSNQPLGDPSDQGLDQLRPLAALPQLAAEANEAGYDDHRSRCLAIWQAAAMGRDGDYPVGWLDYVGDRCA